MPPLHPLTSAADFERVRREGRSHAHPLIVLVACPHPPSARPQPTRVGVVAGKRVGNAVARNRAKRLMREALRAYQTQIASGWDLIFIGRAPLAEATLANALMVIDNLLTRAHIKKADA